MVWGTFFPCLPVGVRACQDGLGHFFPTFARLTERRGSLKLFGQGPCRTNTFQKEASLKLLGLTSIDPTSGGELKCFCTITEI